MLRPLRTLAAAVVAWLPLSAVSSAQCLLADNMDGGPCCGLTQAQLPAFKNFQQDALDICWRDCGVDQLLLVRGKWFNVNTFGPVPCGEKSMRLDIVALPNTLLWRGQLRLTYARTWLVVDNQGLPRQVWRFLVNGDLRNYPAAGSPPCPVPSCAPVFGNKVRFTGYVDFAQDCSIPNGGFQHSWMLTHACAGFDHHVGFPRAGTFHPDRSFSFVAPAAGFVPGPIQPTEGTPISPFETLHERFQTPPPVTLACTYEETLVHTLTPQQQLCFCGSPGTNQFMFGDLNIQTPCGTAIRNPPGGPLLPGFVSMGLGSWTNLNVYPGPQTLRWNIGAYDYQSACFGPPQHEVFFGVTTIGGYPAFQLLGGVPGGPLPPIFIDQANSQNGAGSNVMNVPFTSFHIVNLNH